MLNHYFYPHRQIKMIFFGVSFCHNMNFQHDCKATFQQKSCQDLIIFIENHGNLASVWSTRLLSNVINYPVFVPLSHRSTVNLSFFDFLGEDLVDDNKTAKVVAQDFFRENLYNINDFMEVLKLKKLTTVDDFNLIDFYESFIALSGKEDLTEEEQLLVQYYTCCEKRHAPEEVAMIDKQYKKPLYTCYQCKPKPKTFILKGIYDNHLRAYHSGVKNPFPCGACGISFTTYSGLQSHVKHAHKDGGKSYFPCPFGNKTEIYSQASLDFHVKRFHDESKGYPCEYTGCALVFGSQQVLNHHINTMHVNPKTYVCKIPHCTSLFPTPQRLIMHMRRAHKDIEFKCPFEKCQRNLPTRQSVDRHVEQRHNQSFPLTCDDCDQTFRMRGDLKRYQKEGTRCPAKKN